MKNTNNALFLELYKKLEGVLRDQDPDMTIVNYSAIELPSMKESP